MPHDIAVVGTPDTKAQIFGGRAHRRAARVILVMTFSTLPDNPVARVSEEGPIMSLGEVLRLHGPAESGQSGNLRYAGHPVHA